MPLATSSLALALQSGSNQLYGLIRRRRRGRGRANAASPSCPPAYIDRLPNEILLQILKYACVYHNQPFGSPWQRSQRAAPARVCARWWPIAEEAIYRHVTVRRKGRWDGLFAEGKGVLLPVSRGGRDLARFIQLLEIGSGRVTGGTDWDPGELRMPLGLLSLSPPTAPRMLAISLYSVRSLPSLLRLVQPTSLIVDMLSNSSWRISQALFNTLETSGIEAAQACGLRTIHLINGLIVLPAEEMDCFTEAAFLSWPSLKHYIVSFPSTQFLGPKSGAGAQLHRTLHCGEWPLEDGSPPPRRNPNIQIELRLSAEAREEYRLYDNRYRLKQQQHSTSEPSYWAKVDDRTWLADLQGRGRKLAVAPWDTSAPR